MAEKHDYRILVRHGKKYRPVADIQRNGTPIWASSSADVLKWFSIDRQELARRKSRLYKRFPKLQLSIRRV